MKGSTTSIKGVRYGIETNAQGHPELVIRLTDQATGRTLFKQLRGRSIIRLPLYEGLDKGDLLPVVIHLTDGLSGEFVGKVAYRKTQHIGVAVDKASARDDDAWAPLESWARGLPPQLASEEPTTFDEDDPPTLDESMSDAPPATPRDATERPAEPPPEPPTRSIQPTPAPTPEPPPVEAAQASVATPPFHQEEAAAPPSAPVVTPAPAPPPPAEAHQAPRPEPRPEEAPPASAPVVTPAPTAQEEAPPAATPASAPVAAPPSTSAEAPSPATTAPATEEGERAQEPAQPLGLTGGLTAEDEAAAIVEALKRTSPASPNAAVQREPHQPSASAPQPTPTPTPAPSPAPAPSPEAPVAHAAQDRQPEAAQAPAPSPAASAPQPEVEAQAVPAEAPPSTPPAPAAPIQVAPAEPRPAPAVRSATPGGAIVIAPPPEAEADAAGLEPSRGEESSSAFQMLDEDEDEIIVGPLAAPAPVAPAPLEDESAGDDVEQAEPEPKAPAPDEEAEAPALDAPEEPRPTPAPPVARSAAPGGAIVIAPPPEVETDADGLEPSHGEESSSAFQMLDEDEDEIIVGPQATAAPTPPTAERPPTASAPAADAQAPAEDEPAEDEPAEDDAEQAEPEVAQEPAREEQAAAPAPPPEEELPPLPHVDPSPVKASDVSVARHGPRWYLTLDISRLGVLEACMSDFQRTGLLIMPLPPELTDDADIDLHIAHPGWGSRHVLTAHKAINDGLRAEDSFKEVLGKLKAIQREAASHPTPPQPSPEPARRSKAPRRSGASRASSGRATPSGAAPRVRRSKPGGGSRPPRPEPGRPRPKPRPRHPASQRSGPQPPPQADGRARRARPRPPVVGRPPAGRGLLARGGDPNSESARVARANDILEREEVVYREPFQQKEQLAGFIFKAACMGQGLAQIQLSQGESFWVFIQEGKALDLHTEPSSDHFGLAEMLKRSGKLTDAEYNAVTAYAAEEMIAIEIALLQKEILSQTQLRAAISARQRHLLKRLMNEAQSGMFVFAPNAPAPQAQPIPGVSLVNHFYGVIDDGVKKLGKGLLDRYLQTHLANYPVMIDPPPTPISALPMSPPRQRFYRDLLRLRHSVRDLTQIIKPVHLSRTLLLFEALGLIELRPRP